MTLLLYTLTGNLLAERTLEFAKAWRPGATQRAAREQFQVGGKGFNVAKMARRLGVNVTAWGFAGGATGAACAQWLNTYAAYPFQLFQSRTETRTGLVVRAPGQPETTFLAPDRAPSADALAACAHQLNTLPADALVALCGSFPGWAEPSAAPLRQALHRRAQAGGLVVDTYGPPLADVVRWPVQLVKINRQEFDALEPPLDGTSVEARLQAALRTLPVKAWVITDGPREVWTASSDGITCAHPPAVEEVSATGSGDVLLAALLAHGRPGAVSLEAAVAAALPLAAANAASFGVADFPLPR